MQKSQTWQTMPQWQLKQANCPFQARSTNWLLSFTTFWLRIVNSMLRSLRRLKLPHRIQMLIPFRYGQHQTYPISQAILPSRQALWPVFFFNLKISEFGMFFQYIIQYEFRISANHTVVENGDPRLPYWRALKSRVVPEGEAAQSDPRRERRLMGPKHCTWHR